MGFLDATSHRLAILLAAVVVAVGCSEDTTGPDPLPGTPLVLDLPDGWPALESPADNRLTIEGVHLGRRLFYDEILSQDRTVSCATCHAPQAAFTDSPRVFSEGIGGALGTRNSMALVNLGLLGNSREFFWDGRAATLEAQAMDPVPDPNEMGLPWPDAIARLQSHSDYPGLFERAFGTAVITADLVTKAIAQFERTLISTNSRYDQWKRGEISPLPAEVRGESWFFSETADCFHCHGNILFSDNVFHNTGLDVESVDLGLMAVTGASSDRGMFKTPTLRNVEFTAPYMHDGRFQTLEEVVEFYTNGVQPSANLDQVLSKHPDLKLQLTESQKADLVAFLKMLSDPDFLTNPEYADPAP